MVSLAVEIVQTISREKEKEKQAFAMRKSKSGERRKRWMGFPRKEKGKRKSHYLRNNWVRRRRNGWGGTTIPQGHRSFSLIGCGELIIIITPHRHGLAYGRMGEWAKSVLQE